MACRALLTLVIGVALAAPFLASAGEYRPPRTPTGVPDLQGVWSNLSLTRLQRPRDVQSLEVSEAEAAEIKRRLEAVRPTDAVGQTESEWVERPELGLINGRRRTSWLTYPANGRLPYSESARAKLTELRAANDRAEGPEELTPADRCLTAPFSQGGPPMLNAGATANYTIVQTAEHLVIVAETNQQVRIVRLGGRHDKGAPPRWLGDSVGRWEGDTLVIETVNFHPLESERPGAFYMSPKARVVERLTRVSPTEIHYAFEVEDPETFTEPWRGELPFRAFAGRTFEFACHEGNYSLPNMLRGARVTEQQPATTR